MALTIPKDTVDLPVSTSILSDGLIRTTYSDLVCYTGVLEGVSPTSCLFNFIKFFLFCQWERKILILIYESKIRPNINQFQSHPSMCTIYTKHHNIIMIILLFIRS